jgi:hypothetical protein
MGGRELGAEARLGRMAVWGGREPGADGSMGRTVPEHGADGSLGRKGGWGGREYGADGCMGCYAHPDTPSSTCTLKLRHFSARGRHLLIKRAFLVAKKMIFQFSFCICLWCLYFCVLWLPQNTKPQADVEKRVRRCPVSLVSARLLPACSLCS